MSAGLLAGLAAGAAPGQQAEAPGTNLFLDVRTGLVSSDNFDRNIDSDGNSTAFETDVTLGFDARTTNQDFALRIGGLFEYGRGPDDVDFEDGFTDPFLAISYDVRNKTSELSFSASVTETDVGFTSSEDLEFDSNTDISSDALVVDEGTRRDFRTDVDLVLGRDGPVTAELGVFLARSTVDGTSDSDLNDSVRYGADARLILAVTRTTDLSFNARYTRREEDDSVDTEETDWQYGVGISTQVNQALVLNASLNFAVNEFETDEEDSREEGPTFSLGLQQTLKNGTVGVDFSSRLTSSGTLSTLQFDRSLQLKAGALSAMAGVTWTDDNDAFAIARVDYTQDFKAGRFNGFLQRSVNTSEDDDDEVVTVVSASYLQQITQASDVNFSVQHTDVDNLSSGEEDREQSSFSVTYSHELTVDWSLNAGVSHSVSRSADRDDITENRVFANIGRRFSLRP